MELRPTSLTAGVLACLLSTSALSAVIVLPKYNVSTNDVSVSGLSSGGYMAAQMHFAYSKTIKKGAGIVAGGPVYCSQGSVAIATGPCMADTASRNLSYLESVINTWSGNGYIDPTSNLAGAKVYLFSGTLDSTVKQPVMNDLKSMYANYISGTNIFYKNTIAAEHSMPTDFSGNACSFNGSPYVNNCNFDAAGEILKWIYGPLNAKNVSTLSGSFINFDQAAFWGNFNPANPNGCWDWWGYDDVNFPAKSGGQMVAIKTMIDRIVSGNAAAPYTCGHWYDSNYWHVYYGRAYIGGDGQVYATNSNQYLGYYSTAAYTDVRRTSAGYYAYGSCP